MKTFISLSVVIVFALITLWLQDAFKETPLVQKVKQKHFPDYFMHDFSVTQLPKVASVGLSEAEARQRGHDVKVSKFPLSVLGKVMILGERHGLVKLVADAKYHELLGVHIVGPHATDLIAEACIALTSEATVDEFVATIHPHPTVSEGIREAAVGVFGQAIHV